MSQQKEPRASGADRRLKILLYLGALVVVGLLLFPAVLALSSNPEFCGKACHSMNPEYQTWKKSSHARIPCYACHINISYLDLLKEKFIVGPEGILATINNSFEKPINASSEYSQKHTDKQRCLRCHSPENRRFTPRKGLNITSKMHLKHLDAGLDCATCHNRITHLGAEKYSPITVWAPNFKYKNFLTMREGCWRCHSENKRYRNEETLKLIKNGKKPPTSCNTCHNPDWNLKPSTGEYNHNPVNGVPWRDGKLRHGLVAKKDFNACTACHRRTATEKPNGLPNCTTTCHGGVTMPHNIPKWATYYTNQPNVPPWRRIHFKEAERLGKEVCEKCHNKNKAVANFCQACHHQRFDAINPDFRVNWKEQHFKVVKQIGSIQCQKCHMVEFCAYCHTNGQKPPPGVFFKPQSDQEAVTQP